ncbi:kinesin-like protein KIF6 [Rhynchophorus ferrugineus]|uniref:kinesin-like protein KIF6 n=1 Tax=Rhynchophorus ferrugineus TaxID=354439 RepID=UPI003FCDF401
MTIFLYRTIIQCYSETDNKQGFNSTIFAYGQTGSGKTYSMTGSSRKYKYRGIIPRSLEYIFSIMEQEEDKPSLYISYVEIYKEICYDLLKSKNKEVALKLEDLPKVVILEDRNGEAHLRNINILPVNTEEEAMRLLFLGETNRVIAETPLNEYSSRSHCIFTIHFNFRGKETDIYIKSKLNFVDLAGSERVFKTKNNGTTLTEAKFINRSLHFLQQVILALSESKRSHIPYRNSTLTFMLKDSLCGNCITVMLATLSFASQHVQESISTCMFAQRVAAIKTEPVVNEIKHPQQEINMLRDEIQQLKRQLSQQNTSYISTVYVKDVSEEDKLKCDKCIEKFINNDNMDIKIDTKLCGYYLLVMKNKIQSLQIELHKLQEMNGIRLFIGY